MIYEFLKIKKKILKGYIYILILTHIVNGKYYLQIQILIQI